METVVVVGAGQAGASLCARLRSNGFEGDIVLVGAEPVPPYQRPPLSKAYLLGDMELERLFLRREQFYLDQNISLRLHSTVTRIDPTTRQIELNGETLEYDHLALTTGSTPRQLPDKIGGSLNGVHVVRTLHDVDKMAADIRPGSNALIVGGGYIGLEAAAVMTKLGLKVTLIEMADRILQRVAAAETSDYFRALHQSHGVKILEQTGLVRLEGDAHVKRAHLGDGTILDVDIVIVGVGIIPNDQLASNAGVHTDNGISVDAYGKTSDPHIWAAGDCASFDYKGSRIRLESVQNAIDQAESIADNILGLNVPYSPNPWFWSDQYDVKLQIAGLNTGYDRVVARKSDDPAVVSHWYFVGSDLLAVDAMNDPRGYMVGKRLIEAGKTVDPTAIADPTTDMKALLKQ